MIGRTGRGYNSKTPTVRGVRRPGGQNHAVDDLQILLAALLVSIAGLNALASWLDIPYPIPLVLGGLALGLASGGSVPPRAAGREGGRKSS